MAQDHTILVYKFRIYPSPETQATLKRWMNDARWLWNWALEQRLNLQNLGYNISFYEQSAIFTQIKKTVPLSFLNKIPRNVACSVLQDLDLAWQRYKNPKLDAEKPKFKKKNKRDINTLTEGSSICFAIGNGWISFPKIKEKIRCVMHRQMQGSPNRIAISVDADQWYVSIFNHIEIHNPTHPYPGTAVGIDRGVVNVIADSNGFTIPNPRFGKKMSEKIIRHQKNLSRKVFGSKNYEKEKLKLARDHRKVRFQRKDHNDKLTHYYAKNHEVVVVEDLKIQNMTSSKKRAAQSAGQTSSGRVTRTAYKAALNAAILDVGWGQIKEMLEKKTRKYGGRLLKVNAAYTSQECSVCGWIDKANRISQSDFCCGKCGHSENADVNAAKVILKRALQPKAARSSRRNVGVAVCGGALSAPVKQKLSVVRRRSSQVSKTNSPVGVSK
jgi:putative transposase